MDNDKEKQRDVILRERFDKYKIPGTILAAMGEVAVVSGENRVIHVHG